MWEKRLSRSEVLWVESDSNLRLEPHPADPSGTSSRNGTFGGQEPHFHHHSRPRTSRPRTAGHEVAPQRGSSLWRRCHHRERATLGPDRAAVATLDRHAFFEVVRALLLHASLGRPLLFGLPGRPSSSDAILRWPPVRCAAGLDFSRAQSRRWPPPGAHGWSLRTEPTPERGALWSKTGGGCAGMQRETLSKDKYVLWGSPRLVS